MAEPGWAVVAPSLEDLASGKGPASRALGRWLARGRPGRLHRAGLHAVIGWAVTGDAEAERRWPPAPVTWRVDLPGDPPAGVLRLDPVHLDVSGARAALLHGDRLGLGAGEARSLEPALRDALEPGADLWLGAPGRWYAALPGLPEAGWTSPDSLAGDVAAALPRGAPGLGRLMASLEMALHDHPVNLARRDAGRPEINGLWPWGWGEEAPPPEPVPDALVAAEHPYAEGLAGRLGARCLAGGLQDGDLPARGAALCETGDARELLETWIAPLAAALARGRIRRLAVSDEQGRWFELRRADVLRFWRRRPRW